MKKRMAEKLVLGILGMDLERKSVLTPYLFFSPPQSSFRKEATVKSKIMLLSFSSRTVRRGQDQVFGQNERGLAFSQKLGVGILQLLEHTASSVERSHLIPFFFALQRA